MLAFQLSGYTVILSSSDREGPGCSVTKLCCFLDALAGTELSRQPTHSFYAIFISTHFADEENSDLGS